MSNALKMLMVMMTMFIGVLAFPMQAQEVFADCSNVTMNSEGNWEVNGEEVGDPASDDAVQSCLESSEEVEGTFLRWVNIIATLAVAFAAMMIIYGGVLYVGSKGDPQKTESAKQTLWYSGVGLLIVASAFAILQLFVNASGGLF